MPNEAASITMFNGVMAEWLSDSPPDIVNGMIKAAWPMIGAYSKQMIKDAVEPAVRVALGEVGADGDAFSINYEDYTLGDKAFELEMIRIISTYENTTDIQEPKLRVIVMRTTVHWRSEMHIYAQLLGTKMGIVDVALSGELSIELVGEIPRPPLFQGMRARFVKPPKISKLGVNANSLLSKVANRDSVKTTFINAALDQLAQKFVTPSRMGVRFDKTADVFRTLYPWPVGLLKLTIRRGENLLPKDGAFGLMATSDPYIKVKCGSMKTKTKTVKRSLNPVFDHVVYVPIHLTDEQRLEFELTDQDIGKDDFMGRFEVDVRKLIEQGREEVPYHVCDAQGESGKSGSLWLQTEWRKLRFQDRDAKGNESSDGLSHLFVGVCHAKNLPVYPKGTKFWVEVQCTGRLGTIGLDAAKPRATPKVMLKEIVQSKEELDEDLKLRKERKDLCAKYKLKPADVEKLLGSEAVESVEVATMASELKINQPLDFFLGDYTKSRCTICLKRLEPKFEQQAATLGGKLYNTVASKYSEMKQDGKELLSRVVNIEELAREANGLKDLVLRNKGEQTSLHVRLQLRPVENPG